MLELLNEVSLSLTTFVCCMYERMGERVSVGKESVRWQLAEESRKIKDQNKKTPPQNSKRTMAIDLQGRTQ
ncbi:hypothetical protein Y1Q_0012202 [Alligator mississippiensis]|uniref:Uncharacterized protein n=1 Tax=Alligator mississippiensis TaxID=8496 RepID=A0A151N5W7_ALLMI|nr:hypothetical protein Y1Q_0012202 [Alligator mississippiensis]